MGFRNDGFSLYKEYFILFILDIKQCSKESNPSEIFRSLFTYISCVSIQIFKGNSAGPLKNEKH